MYGGDNSAHLDIFRTLDRNQGFAIGHNNRANLGSILVAYPQGWHFMGVFVKWTLQGVAPIGASPTSTLLFFYSMATLWFGMMVLLITRLSLLVVHHTTKPKVKKSVAIFSKVIVALSCFIGINGFLLSLFAFGFQTQIAALGFLLAEVVALVAAYSTKDLRQRLGYILLATLLMAASGFSWLFLYPVSGLILFCAVVHTIARYKKLPLYFVVGLIILGAGVLFQPFIQLSVPVPAYQDGVNVINQRGNVVATDMLLIGLLALAAATWAYVYFREATVRILIASLGVAIAFSLVLMWYQLGTIHELRYYYYKSTYTGIMLVIVLLSALVGWAATTLLQSNAPLKKLSIVQKMLVGAGLLGILALSATLIKSPTYDGFIHKSLAGISPAQAGTVVDIAAKQPENGWRVVSIGSCNRGDDIRTTLLADSLSLVPPRGTKSPGHFIRLDKLEKQTLFAGIDKFISQDDGTPSLIILSNDQVIGAELMSALSPAHQSRIQLINLDPSIETEPALQCPERVR
jgi:hypothetical protein